MKRFDAVLLEKEGESGLTGKEVVTMMSMLAEDEVYPIEYYNRGGESSAMGFITRSAADRLDFCYYNNDPIGNFVGDILADMELESKDETYQFKDLYGENINIFLTRNLPTQDLSVKLCDLLPLISDESTVVVTEDYSEVARYDGRDSIPMELNSRKVLDIGIREVLEANAEPAIAIEIDEA